MSVFNRKRLAALERRVNQLERNQVTEKEQLEALEAGLATVATDLAAASSTLQAELNTLQEAVQKGEPVNLSKAIEAAKALDVSAQAVGALKPTV